MSSTDFSGARSALTGALGVAGPILTALQQAEQVFGVLANAEKHSKMLAKEVADHKAALADHQAAVAKAKEQVVAVLSEIGVAEKQADERITAALASEKEQVAAAKKAAAEAKRKLADETAAAQQAANSAVALARDASEKVLGELAAKEAALNTSIATLEKKLDTLRTNAQKFAAALTAE